MGAKTGGDCKLYINTGSWASPTWTEVTNVRDLTMSLSKTLADASRRVSAWKQYVSGQKDTRITFQMVWDDEDTNFQLFLDAYNNDTTVECLVISGAYNVAGTEGLRAVFEIANCQRNEPLDDVVTAEIELAPAYDANGPVWYTGAAA